MTFELRPTTHEAFAERLRSAEARKLAELNSTTRKPRSSDRRRALNMRAIEANSKSWKSSASTGRYGNERQAATGGH